MKKETHGKVLVSHKKITEGMALPHHNRGHFCNLFLKVIRVRLRGGIVRPKRPMRLLGGSMRLKRLLCGSCALSALCAIRVGRIVVIFVRAYPKSVPQGLKPSLAAPRTARLKSGPDTKHESRDSGKSAGSHADSKADSRESAYLGRQSRRAI